MQEAKKTTNPGSLIRALSRTNRIEKDKAERGKYFFKLFISSDESIWFSTESLRLIVQSLRKKCRTSYFRSTHFEQPCSADVVFWPFRHSDRFSTRRRKNFGRPNKTTKLRYLQLLLGFRTSQFTKLWAVSAVKFIPQSVRWESQSFGAGNYDVKRLKGDE